MEAEQSKSMKEINKTIKKIEEDQKVTKEKNDREFSKAIASSVGEMFAPPISRDLTFYIPSTNSVDIESIYYSTLEAAAVFWPIVSADKEKKVIYILPQNEEFFYVITPWEKSPYLSSINVTAVPSGTDVTVSILAKKKYADRIDQFKPVLRKSLASFYPFLR